MTGAAPRMPRTQPLDADAIRATVQKLLAARDAARKLRQRLALAEESEREQCKQLAALSRGSLAGIVVDGQAVTIHEAPGKAPMVHLRPVVVLPESGA
jgi:hypothetical protein